MAIVKEMVWLLVGQEGDSIRRRKYTEATSLVPFSTANGSEARKFDDCESNPVKD